MKVEFLTASTVQARLAQYIKQYDELHWATAWATDHAVAKLLFANARKFKHVTFGVAFNQTAPEIIDKMVGLRGARAVISFPGGTFHPKVYAFRSGRDVAAIVGSANFTRGGLGGNCEAAVALRGTMNDQALKEIIAFAKTSSALGKRVTRAFATVYRASCERAAKLPKGPRDPVPLRFRNALPGDALQMDWQAYAKRIREFPSQEVAARLQILATARQWFATTGSFANFPDLHRKAIGGVLGERQKLGIQLNQPWAWFGSMSGAGDFANRISENDGSLAAAIDSIPLSGDVSRAQYERFCSLFRAAFARSTRVGGVPTASRLLAMKRPDTFICISRPNIVRASGQFQFARTTLTLENYWERIVEPLRLSSWYNAEKPAGVDGELWEARAAMLDTLLYQP